MAKRCVDMGAEYCLYTIGLGSKDRVSLAIDDADLVMTLGFDMVEYHPQLWNPKEISRSFTPISCRPRSMRITIRKSS